MLFRTELSVSGTKAIGLEQAIVTIGSCFSDAIGQQLSQNKFKATVNPFGTCYNPISIHQLLTLACHNAAPAADSYLEQNGIHANYLFHSRFSSLSRGQLEQQLKSTLNSVHQYLQKASVVMITYGTAWVYQRSDTGEIVNNCHKVSSTKFTKRLLEVEEIVQDFTLLAKELVTINPSVQFILTLSPVRHLKDTLELNSVSKSIVRQAIYKITQQHKTASYFPAYELLLDDLRDYRFYKSDMLHPSEEAEKYIWNKFAQAYFDTTTLEFIRKWTVLQHDLNHKPFQPHSPAHQAFLQSLKGKLMELKSMVDVEEELSIVQSQISN